MKEGEEETEEEHEAKSVVNTQSSSLSSSTTEESILEIRKIRRRVYRRTHYHRTHPFSRIPSNDIRKQFPTLWLNIFHQCNPPLYASFFKHLAHKHIIIGSTGWNPGKDGHVATYIPHVCVECSLAKFLASYLHRCAVSVDMICELRGSEIRRSRVSKGTEVALNLRTIYTSVYELDFPVDCSILANDVSDLIPYRKLSPKPMKLVVDCILSFHFEENAKFMDHCCLHFKSINSYPIDSRELR
eukprot:gene4985-5474_t